MDIDDDDNSSGGFGCVAMVRQKIKEELDAK
jgi:hypothetical protein